MGGHFTSAHGDTGGHFTSAHGDTGGQEQIVEQLTS
ncbi:MAG: hypothetical protein QOJ19_197 [Acidimicrobiia bacterium]|nr:hypothetical protein [Acidimicrobiia bacterium]